VADGPVRGTAVVWHGEEGWGILRSPDVPSDVWCHFSAIRQDGYRELIAGEQVSFTYQAVEQDGYHYAADEVRRESTPGGGTPVTPDESPQSQPGSSPAYQSRLTVRRSRPRRGRP
jgi:CspA family cold shock protein